MLLRLPTMVWAFLFGAVLPSVAQERPPTWLRVHGEEFVRAVVFSPDDRFAITSGTSGVIVWDNASGLPMRSIDHQKASVDWSSDGQRVVVAGEGVRLFDVSTWQPLPYVDTSSRGRVWSATFSPDGSMLAVARYHGIELNRMPNGDRLLAIDVPLRGPARLSISPDGRYLVCAMVDSTVGLWSLESGELVRQFGAGAGSAIFSADGRSIVVDIHGEDSVASFDFESGALLWGLRGEYTYEYPTTSKLAASPDGHFVAVHRWGSWKGRYVDIIEAATGNLVNVVRGTTEGFAFSHDGRRFLVGGGFSGPIEFAVDGFARLREFHCHLDRVGSVAVSSDNQLVGSSDATRTMIWDPVNGLPVSWVEHVRRSGEWFSFANGDRSLIYAATDSTIVFVDASSGAIEKEVILLAPRIGQPALSPDRALLAVPVARGVDLYRLEPWDRVQQFRDTIFYGGDVEFSPDGASVYLYARARGDRTSLMRWNIASGSMEMRRTFGNLWLAGRGDMESMVVPSPDGRSIAVLSGDRSRVVLRDAVDGDSIAAIQDAAHRVRVLATDGIGDLVAAGEADGRISLWRQTDGGFLGSFAAHDDVILGLAFSPDGRRILSAGRDRTARVFDIETHALVAATPVGTDWIFDVEWSAAGNRFYTAGADGTVREWDAATGELSRYVGSHDDWVLSLALSPDGKTLASSGADRSIRLWDIEMRQLVRTLSGHRDAVTSIAFSPDGLRLVSSSYRTLWEWDMTTGQPIDSSRRFNDWMHSLAFAPDGSAFTVAGRDGRLDVWNRDGTLRWTRDDLSPLALAFASDASRLFVSEPQEGPYGSEYVEIQGVSASTGAATTAFADAVGEIHAVAFAPDGRTVVTGSADGRLRVWDVEDGRTLASFRQTSSLSRAIPVSIAVAPSGEFAIVGWEDGAVSLCDISAPFETVRPDPHGRRMQRKLEAIPDAAAASDAFTARAALEAARTTMLEHRMSDARLETVIAGRFDDQYRSDRVRRPTVPDLEKGVASYWSYWFYSPARDSLIAVTIGPGFTVEDTTIDGRYARGVIPDDWMDSDSIIAVLDVDAQGWRPGSEPDRLQLAVARNGDVRTAQGWTSTYLKIWEAFWSHGTWCHADAGNRVSFGCYTLASVGNQIDENAPTLSLAPNPTHGNLLLAIRSVHSGTARVDVTDVRGRSLMMRDVDITSPGQAVVELRIDAAPGIYIVTCLLAGRRSSISVVVE